MFFFFVFFAKQQNMCSSSSQLRVQQTTSTRPECEAATHKNLCYPTIFRFYVMHIKIDFSHTNLKVGKTMFDLILNRDILKWSLIYYCIKKHRKVVSRQLDSKVCASTYLQVGRCVGKYVWWQVCRQVFRQNGKMFCPYPTYQPFCKPQYPILHILTLSCISVCLFFKISLFMKKFLI